MKTMGNDMRSVVTTIGRRRQKMPSVVTTIGHPRQKMRISATEIGLHRSFSNTNYHELFINFSDSRLYDKLNGNYTDMGTVEIGGHTYKIFKAHDYEFIFNIY